MNLVSLSTLHLLLLHRSPCTPDFWPHQPWQDGIQKMDLLHRIHGPSPFLVHLTAADLLFACCRVPSRCAFWKLYTGYPVISEQPESCLLGKSIPEHVIECVVAEHRDCGWNKLLRSCLWVLVLGRTSILFSMMYHGSSLFTSFPELLFFLFFFFCYYPFQLGWDDISLWFWYVLL